jgi:uncharacterized membrane protein YccC
VVLALWVGASALVSSLLRNFMSTAAALSGYTAVIIAAALLGEVGGASDKVFFYALARTSEICIGIVCAGVVLAVTDLRPDIASAEAKVLLQHLPSDLQTASLAPLPVFSPGHRPACQP